ncbi:MAG: hypothetical protein HOY79_04425 [Streptomyces sp.]|nr:hypothetical protein [Streptomyces sp.]NUS15451.1 hypothetical protein [Streptomyces sp.]NUS24091.1 hypothetical protein [Streptomyces sp.]
MPEPTYVGSLAKELLAAEKELQTYRGFKTTVADFINNPNIALDIRQNLARDLRLPEPSR